MGSKYDIAVIGAGPAGMMAAVTAASQGKKVILLEKNSQAGKKLLLTGHGRCNLTNAEFDLKNLVSNYGKKGRFLFHAFSVFGPEEVIAFFNRAGLATKIEAKKRVFPVSNKAEDVLAVLIKEINKKKVAINYQVEVLDIICQNKKIKKIILNNNKEIIAKNYILATGGKSHSLTGSTGQGFSFAEKIGHKINELSPALVPIMIKEKWVADLQGLSLSDVQIDVCVDNKKILNQSGDILFTHFGLSGPGIINISSFLSEHLAQGEVKIVLNLLPQINSLELDKIILHELKIQNNKEFKNINIKILPQRLINILAEQEGIDLQKKTQNISKAERQALIKKIAALELTAKNLKNWDAAMVTKGGASLKEIDDKTMRSKIIANLFFSGEIIDLIGPTGGFNLQQAWSTGYLAGLSAASEI